MQHANTAAALICMGGSLLLAAPAKASLITFDFENYDSATYSFAPSEIDAEALDAGLKVSPIQGTTHLYPGPELGGHPERDAAVIQSTQMGDKFTFTITPPAAMQLKLTAYRLDLGATRQASPALRLDIAGDPGPDLAASKANFNSVDGSLDATLPAGQPATINLTVVSDVSNNIYINDLELDGQLKAVTVPEPMSLLLLGAGGLAVTMRRRPADPLRMCA